MQKPDRSVFLLFLRFLFHPEDSGNAPMRHGRRHQFARFDTPLAGAVKIVFWIGMVVLFWTGVPVVCRCLEQMLP
jgi:hypothetical protein